MDTGFTVQLGATYYCRKGDGTYYKVKVLKMRTNNWARKEEYMVCSVGAPLRLPVWVDKSWLMPLNPQKDEYVEERTDPRVSENNQCLEYIKHEEGEPETQTRKSAVYSYSASRPVRSGSFSEAPTCMLCRKPYKYPVRAECGHRVCQGCIFKARVDTGSITCPACNEGLTQKMDITNGTMAKLQRKMDTAPDCPQHRKKVKLYCKDDGTLCCTSCKDSPQHAIHTLLPIMEAARVYWTQLSGLINSLEESLRKTDVVQCQEHIEQHKPIMAEHRQRIVSDFEKLNNFLKEQKEKLLLELHEISPKLLQEMRSNADKLEEGRDFLQEAAAEAREREDDYNAFYFLAGVKQFLEMVQEQKRALQALEKAVTEKELCRGTFKGPIQYMVWKQMYSVISPIPDDGEKYMPYKIEEETSVLVPESSAPDQNLDAEEGVDEEAAQAPESAAPDQNSDAEKGVDEEAAQAPESAEAEESEENEGDYYEEEASQMPYYADLHVDYEAKYHVRRKRDFHRNLPASLPSLEFREKKIWIIGDPFVCLAYEHARKRPYGVNLALKEKNWTLHWLGTISQWVHLFKAISIARNAMGDPAAVVLHLGGYDLENQRHTNLTDHAGAILLHLLNRYPQARFVWSAILPERRWLNTDMERQRKEFNSSLAAYVKPLGYEVIPHQGLEQRITTRFTKGSRKTELCKVEIDLFLKGIRNALLKVMEDRKLVTESYRKPQRQFAAVCDQPQTSVPTKATPIQPQRPPQDFSLDVPLPTEW